VKTAPPIVEPEKRVKAAEWWHLQLSNGVGKAKPEEWVHIAPVQNIFHK